MSKTETAAGRWDKDSDNNKVTKIMRFDEIFGGWFIFKGSV